MAREGTGYVVGVWREEGRVRLQKHALLSSMTSALAAFLVCWVVGVVVYKF